MPKRDEEEIFGVGDVGNGWVEDVGNGWVGDMKKRDGMKSRG